ncbi:amidohydrolase [Thalassotalea profundi]|uniref:Amidohydrolase n=1 Tax=Thalassotalea profundi TaxID=2036687 RepID=A0ABQ3IHW3_9GAMM|nr:amidohydrolase [Thalassotalea profundi]GHE85029.1 amidohydrolase [Thalassotalea profundi]
MTLSKIIPILLLFYITNVIANTTIISNIKGYSIENKQLKSFHALQFTNDKIDKLYLENDKVIIDENITVINGQGKTLLPGLIDAHGHVLSYGLSLLNVDLVGTTSEEEAVKRTLEYAKKNPDLDWIHGRGWNQVQWKKNTFPTAKTLDVVFPNQPVWLKRIDGHAGWANSKAMELAGITAKTTSPDGGEIIKDAKGRPTGVFIDNAMALIGAAIPPLTSEDKKIALKKAMHSLVSMGLTSVHDAGVDSSDIALYKSLAQSNQMPIRINAMLYLPSPEWQDTLDKGLYKSQDDLFLFNSVKIQADGALGSRGAALIEDYSDHAGNKGLLLHSSANLSKYIETAMTAGFQVNTHAIGDNANTLTLDLYEKLIDKTESQALRHRIEHAQILQLSDIPRFDQLGVIASMQATHATSDKNMAVERIGDKRILGAYAWRKLLNANAVIAAGSDFPVESPNPFFGLHASVTRQDHANTPENGWFPEEKMTRLESLKSFTIDAAYSGHQENIIGSLAEGKKADFILVEDDYFNMPEENIWKIKVLGTWVNGKQVFNIN